jgi:hypothetical protein
MTYGKYNTALTMNTKIITKEKVNKLNFYELINYIITHCHAKSTCDCCGNCKNKEFWRGA